MAKPRYAVLRMPNRFLRLGVWLGALAIAACGGGGGDDGGQNLNSAPTITGRPLPQVMLDNPYNFAPVARDADGDVLTFSIENRPPWASFDNATGVLSGTPQEADLGTYLGIVISVSDGLATTRLADFAVEVVVTGSGSATLSWIPPTGKTDGSPLNLAGYKIYWGTMPGNYTHVLTLDNPGLVSYVVEGLTPATWYFAATALDSQGAESQFSNEASKNVL